MCFRSQFECITLSIDNAISTTMLILQFSSIAQSFNWFYSIKVDPFEQPIESTETERPMVFDQSIIRM
jgi:hypothetical protein